MNEASLMYKENILKQTDMYDNFHTNPTGSKKIAKYIYKKLKMNSF